MLTIISLVIDWIFMIFFFVFFIRSKFYKHDHSYICNNKIFIKKKSRKESTKPTMNNIKNRGNMILEIILHQGLEIFRNRGQSVGK